MTSHAAELELFKDTITKYIQRELSPRYAQWEADSLVPREVWSDLGQQGLLCVDIPTQYGGCDADAEFSIAVVEELGRANLGALATNVTVHSDIVAHYIVQHGSDEQKARYLPKMASGEWIGAIAMTEPGCGSDLQGIRASAKAEGDHFVINGTKTFITNGQHCDFVIVAARTDSNVKASSGTSLFIVDCSQDGFSRGRQLEKIGMHAGDTSELMFDNVRVSKADLIGELHRGFAVLMSELQRERLALACIAVAAAEGNFEATCNYLGERSAFGQTLSAFQALRHRVAELATEIRVHKSFVTECKQLFSAGQLDVPTVSMAKLSATEMQGRVADACLQLHGGYGYMSEYGVSRAFVDARVQRIYGGTSEIMKEIISRSVLD